MSVIWVLGWHILINILLHSSTYTVVWGSDLKTPGIAVKISKAGLAHLTNIAEDMLPKIFSDIAFPDIKGSAYWTDWEVSSLKIVAIDRPSIQSTFTNDGIHAFGFLESGNLSAKYKLGNGLFMYSGELHGVLNNFTLNSTFGMNVVKQGEPQIVVKHCNITIESSQIAFTGRMGSLFTAASSAIADKIRNYVSDLICNLLVWATTYEGRSPNSESLLCAEDNPRMSNTGGRVPFSERRFAINMSLVENPGFYPNHADVGFNGTILYNDHLSRRSYVAVEPGPYRPDGGKMLRIAVSSMVSNSFFSHVFAYSLGSMHKTMGLNKFPPAMRKPLKLICRSCTVNLHAGLTRAPIMLIRPHKKGVRVNIYGWVRTYIRAFGRRIEVFWADTLIRAKAYPYVSNDRLHAHTIIDKIHVNTNRRSGLLGKVFGIFLKDAAKSINSFVPLHLSGPVNRALKKIFGPKGGVPLPQACGVKFVNSRLFHIQNAVIIDTDLEYNTDRLVRQFRKLMSKKAPRP